MDIYFINTLALDAFSLCFNKYISFCILHILPNLWAHPKLKLYSVKFSRSVVSDSLQLQESQQDALKSLGSECSSVQFSRSVVSDSLRPHESQHVRPPLSITISRSSLRPTSIESVMSSSHLILGRPLLLLPLIPPSMSLFQWVNSSHEVAKVLEFQL